MNTLAQPADVAAGSHLDIVFGLPARQTPALSGDVSVGSSPASDFPLPHASVSPQHCRITAGESGCWIEDAGSATGTFVNGVAVRGRVRLKSGDLIHAGSVGLRWFADGRRTMNLSMITRGRSVQEFDLLAPALTLGTDVESDVILAGAGIAGRHARIERGAAGAVIVALTETSECLVNGRHFARHHLVFGDQVDLGPFHLLYDGRGLRLVQAEAGAGLDAEALTSVVKGRRMIDRVSLRIEANEFVGIIGPTGAGKSTLLRALNGERPANTGTVRLNGHDLYANLESFRREFGWVPQENILHRELTLAEALVFSARLRLPRDTPRRELAGLVTEVAQRIGLQNRMNAVVRTLSGGELKKASVAVEMLSRPHLLFLDEPTSGLDPGAEARMMELLRQFADGGCTVICTTHVMQHLYLLDRLIVLADGELVFSGRPEAAREFFGVREMADIFGRLEERRAADWRLAFQAMVPDSPEPAPLALPSRRGRTAFQPLVLFARQWATWSSDWRNCVILLSQPLLIGALLAVAVQGTLDNSALKLFFVSVATLWFGCSNGAQEIIGEVAIYRRERMAGLHRGSYLFAKWVFLSLATLLQSGLLYATARLLGAGIDGAVGWHVAGLAMMSLAAAAFGLAISAFSRSATQAVLLVPLLIIPQIVLSGYTVPASGMTPPVLAVSEYVPSFQLQRTMDVGLVWEQRIDAATLQRHLQAVQNLNLEGALKTGTVFADPQPGLWAVGILAGWLLVAYLLALTMLRLKEREL